jgi:hypothetical protein
VHFYAPNPLVMEAPNVVRPQHQALRCAADTGQSHPVRAGRPSPTPLGSCVAEPRRLGQMDLYRPVKVVFNGENACEQGLTLAIRGPAECASCSMPECGSLARA